jgi:hypothetical protein
MATAAVVGQTLGAELASLKANDHYGRRDPFLDADAFGSDGAPGDFPRLPMLPAALKVAHISRSASHPLAAMHAADPHARKKGRSWAQNIQQNFIPSSEIICE